MTEAHNEEARAIENTKVKVENVNRDLKADIKELREQADTQVNWFWGKLRLAMDQNEWL